MKLTSLVLAATLAASAALAQPKTTIEVQYPYGYVFENVFNELKREFEKTHGDIVVNYRTPYKEYEDGAQTALRQAITKQLPDVSLQAINLQRTFFDRKIAVDLTPFIEKEAKWKEEGFSDAMMALGNFGGRQYGLAFAVSTPVIYFNEDLVRKAGGDPEKFPSDWEGIMALAQKIKALDGDLTGMFHSWSITGNWMWQALIFANGGKMLTADEKTVAFDQAAGQKAIETLGAMASKAGMPNLSHEAARQTFFAGKMGIWTESTSLLRVANDGVGGKFKWRTARFPVSSSNAKLPTGGAAAMMFASEPAKRDAAWKFMKFITGPVGATIMVKGSGYLPPNALPADDPNMLKPFYEAHPNHLIALGQAPLMTAWYAFPGENSLKIISVIKDHLQTVVDKSVAPDAALKGMSADVQKLLPR